MLFYFCLTWAEVHQIVCEIIWQFVREIVLCVDALFSYRTENRIPIRFAANRTPIRTGNRTHVDIILQEVHKVLKPFVFVISS
jgi:hypothetical protein